METSEHTPLAYQQRQGASTQACKTCTRSSRAPPPNLNQHPFESTVHSDMTVMLSLIKDTECVQANLLDSRQSLKAKLTRVEM